MTIAHALNEQVFRFLQGKWSVHRQFTGSYQGSFQGAANFVPESDAAPSCLYSEQGELTDGAGKRFDARQTYRYRLAGDKLQVLKREASDWRVMHALEFRMQDGIATATHTHHCGQDDYDTVYRIDFAGSWELSYSVSGPKKDYRIRSVYARSQA